MTKGVSHFVSSSHEIDKEFAFIIVYMKIKVGRYLMWIWVNRHNRKSPMLHPIKEFSSNILDDFLTANLACFITTASTLSTSITSLYLRKKI